MSTLPAVPSPVDEPHEPFDWEAYWRSEERNAEWWAD